jgi:hypothetical protein
VGLLLKGGASECPMHQHLTLSGYVAPETKHCQRQVTASDIIMASNYDSS